jgi:acetyl esterase/lipase
MTEKVGIDPSFVPEKVQTRANDYVASADPANPAISPLFADLRGLPPTLIQAGSNEILFDDSARRAAPAASDDVAVILDVTPGVPHLFQSRHRLPIDAPGRNGARLDLKQAIPLCEARLTGRDRPAGALARLRGR